MAELCREPGTEPEFSARIKCYNARKDGQWLVTFSVLEQFP